MDRRHYGENSYYGRSYQNQGSPPYYGGPGGGVRPSEEELVARSKEWMSRQDRDRDPWRRSVDDFLDDRVRHHKGGSGGRERSPRDRSRSRERIDRKDKHRASRERRAGSREPRRRSPMLDEEEREHRRHIAERWNEERMRERGERRDWNKWGSGEERHDRRWSRDDDDERGSGKMWSSEEDNSNSYDRPEHDYKYSSDTLRSEDRYAYKKQVPQRTVIIRGLAQHITEQDIQDDIAASQLVCKDIRLVRRKGTGTSRGFAFVEFHDVADATKWIESKQGELMLKDHFRALLQYSLPKEDVYSRNKWWNDWYCKCQAHNFRRRDTCFMCNLSRREGEIMEGTDEVSSHPTNTVILRGLDALTTEESVLQSIKTLSTLPIRSVRIGRDPVTNTSRGVCYLEMNSVVDAMYLHNTLQTSCPEIDGRTAIISYAKLDPLTLHSSAAISGQIANAAVQAAQWSHQKTDGAAASSQQQYTLADVPRLAEYSASLYATNQQEKATYLAFYEDYYRKQITEGEKISLPTSAAGGWPGAHQAKKPKAGTTQANGSKASAPLSEAPDGSGSATYPQPDVSTYQYDKSSGYYYDPYTTLYYDANSQYYYNNKSSKFLYWDASKNTYLPAPTTPGSTQVPDKTPLQAAADTATKEEDKKNKEKENEKDKVKVAKRIAKDMERWAKTLNQKKEIAKQNVVAATAAAIQQMKAPGAADIGYAVLERKEMHHAATSSVPAPLSNGLDAMRPSKNESLVAAYGQGSDSEEEIEDAMHEDRLHTDWTKLACLLCKRQFPSKDVLVKHQQLSDLHKQNLSAWYKSKGLDPDDAQKRSIQYRDRAKERRQKYGEPDTLQPNRLKENYMKAREATVSYEEPTKAGIGKDNLGSKLLQKMGWQEGMGLGKTNQGRTSIIQAERRSASAGLGSKSVGVTPGPGETYKDCVIKMMHIRYSELDKNS